MSEDIVTAGADGFKRVLDGLTDAAHMNAFGTPEYAELQFRRHCMMMSRMAKAAGGGSNIPDDYDDIDKYPLRVLTDEERRAFIENENRKQAEWNKRHGGLFDAMVAEMNGLKPE